MVGKSGYDYNLILYRRSYLYGYLISHSISCKCM